jgi:hypothetical protein
MVDGDPQQGSEVAIAINTYIKMPLTKGAHTIS